MLATARNLSNDLKFTGICSFDLLSSVPDVLHKDAMDGFCSKCTQIWAGYVPVAVSASSVVMKVSRSSMRRAFLI